jgi:hypothetical protein
MIDETLWEPDEIAVFEYFGYKCIHCGRGATVLHELVPKSRTKDWKRPGNRVALDAPCHGWAHRVGTRVSTPILKEDLKKWQSHKTSTPRIEEIQLED